MSAALDALKTRFVARCAADRLELQAAVADRDEDAVKRLAHKVAGAGGTFGFPELSRAAMAVEDCIDQGAFPPADLLSELDQRLVEAAGA